MGRRSARERRSDQNRKADMGPAAGAALRAVLGELAEEAGGQLVPTTWSELLAILDERRGGSTTVADGAAVRHEAAARYEAAAKLLSNHVAVLQDVTRADGPSATQPQLARLPG